MQVVWKEATGRYQTGENAFVGKWQVASIFYDACRPQGNDAVYGVRVLLPGLKSLANQKTIEDAKQSAQRAIDYWFAECEPSH